MAFKNIEHSSVVPNSPEKIIRDLPRRKFFGALAYQEKLMQDYALNALHEKDIALQLPTGGGKTLVGLMIGEWRRRKFNDKIVYLVPTKQLVNQVVEQANEKYGLIVNGFTGASKDYDVVATTSYKRGESMAISTYSSLFNTNPFFNDPDIIILDDVHAAESYISNLWSIRIQRMSDEHKSIHSALCALLKPLLASYTYTRLIGEVPDPAGGVWVDKLPTPQYFKIIDQIIEVLDIHTKNTDLIYPWNMIRDNLCSCHLYYSSQEILIRPLIPPTWTHEAFTNPKQRIYMSATLSKGGDIERLTGRSSIKKLATPEGADNHGVGRRFFVFPEMSLNENDTRRLNHELMQQTDRSLVLVPNLKSCSEIKDEIEETIGYKIFTASDIQKTKKVFTKTKKAIAIMANRYDGVDFSGDECRLLFVEGLPRSTNTQEQFIMSRMGASILFDERIQTRVLQAIGRCTRSLEDYSTVVISGNELLDYLINKTNIQYFHPELQAELNFGIEQSKNINIDDIIENVNIFLENGKTWEEVSQQIVALREGANQNQFPAIDELQLAVVKEIEYERHIWQKDYEAALKSADAVLSELKSSELKGYRALWHYLAGSAAWLAVASKQNTSLITRSRDEFSLAKKAAQAVSWLVTLSQFSNEQISEKDKVNNAINEQIERLELTLASLGTTYTNRYANYEKEILEGIESDNANIFENAHVLLGRLIGLEAGNEENDGSPDPWWINANKCLIFEDNSSAKPETPISVNKARQVASHPLWVRENILKDKESAIFPVLITPSKNVKETAVSLLEDTLLWDLDDFKQWAHNAIAVIRDLRTSFVAPGDLAWRSSAIIKLKENNLDIDSLINLLKPKKAKNILKPIK
ncbi:MAG: helicase C-terminal domain-containing protein [Candidatus Pacebacteria bacterium]|nr:helicase C-terminal domain-containing protein [Candidatus Paceibacterota bacterium]